jgi:hypothetical protein
VLGGNLRHLPGGVDEYLKLRSGQLSAASAAASSTGKAKQPENSNRPKGAELRAAEKELAAAGRKIEKSTARITDIQVALATHDQSDYAGLGKLSDELSALEKTVAEVESRWLELTELLG